MRTEQSHLILGLKAAGGSSCLWLFPIMIAALPEHPLFSRDVGNTGSFQSVISQVLRVVNELDFIKEKTLAKHLSRVA